MIQDSLLLQQRHQRFIEKVCESGLVYGLESKDGFASSTSVHHEDENGTPIGLICFWAEPARARSCIKEAWSHYHLSKIPLAEFMENWCIGMGNDGLLIGTEFDAQMFGYEADPYPLILDLCAQLQLIDKELNFKKFKDVGDFEAQVKAVLK